MKALLIRTDGIGEIMDFPEKAKLDWYYEQIGCDYIDIVRPYGIDRIAEKHGLKSLPDKFCMIVDDEALLKAEPKINVIASLLYGADDHGQAICGDVLIAKNQFTEEGVDSVGMDENDMLLLQSAINGLIEMHNEKVKEARKDGVDG